MPIWARKFFVDFVETGIGALLALVFVVPTNPDQAKELAFVIGAAVIGALASAIRRAVPGFLAWLKAETGTEDPPAALGKPFIPGDKE
jgi:hypothetical protein